MGGNDRPATIRMVQHHVTARLMIHHEPRTEQDVDECFRLTGWESHREGIVTGILSVLMTSVGPSSGMGSPCLIKLAT